MWIIFLFFFVLCCFALEPGLGVLVILAFVGAIVYACSSDIRQNKTNRSLAENGQKEISETLSAIEFNTSKEIPIGVQAYAPVLKVDSSSKQIAICDYLKNKLTILSFSEILDCEVFEDSSTILSGGVGRAVVGGMIAGGTGAVVGAATRKSKDVTNSLRIQIITADIDDSLMVFDLITSETSRDSDFYKKSIHLAQEVHSTLISIIKTQQNSQLVAEEQPTKQTVAQLSTEDAVNQLKLLNDLKKQGIITEEEYNQKREKLVEAL
jgi:hypothetical protein